MSEIWFISFAYCRRGISGIQDIARNVITEKLNRRFALLLAFYTLVSIETVPSIFVTRQRLCFTTIRVNGENHEVWSFF